MKPTQIEEKLISSLAKVAVKLYDKYGWSTFITSLVVSGIFTALSSFLLIVLGTFSLGMPQDLFRIFCVSSIVSGFTTSLVLISVYTYFMMQVIWYGKSDLIANTKIRPNKNKYTRWLYTCRLEYPLLCLLFLVSVPNHGVYSVGLLFALFGSTLGLYVFCVDMPQRKTKTVEMKSSHLSFVG